MGKDGGNRFLGKLVISTRLYGITFQKVVIGKALPFLLIYMKKEEKMSL